MPSLWLHLTLIKVRNNLASELKDCSQINPFIKVCKNAKKVQNTTTTTLYGAEEGEKGKTFVVYTAEVPYEKDMSIPIRRPPTWAHQRILQSHYLWYRLHLGHTASVPPTWKVSSILEDREPHHRITPCALVSCHPSINNSNKRTGSLGAQCPCHHRWTCCSTRSPTFKTPQRLRTVYW